MEAYVIPMQRLLEQKMMESLLRIQTSKASGMIENARRGEAIGQGRIGSGWRPWEWSPLEIIKELTAEQLG